MRLRSGSLVLALTAFAAVAVGATGGLLLARHRAAALEAIADRQALLVGLQARLIDEEVRRLVEEMQRLSKLAEVDLADDNMEPEKRVLRIARRDTALFSAAIFILDARGDVLWAEPLGALPVSPPAQLVGAARGRAAAVVKLSPGALEVAAPISGRGAIVGQVNTTARDVFGEGIGRALSAGGFALLLTESGSDRGVWVARAGAARSDLSASRGQRWLQAQDGARWLVSEAKVGDGPLVLRLAQPAREIEREVWRSLRSVVLTLGGALLLAVVVGGLLALAIGRLERAEVELGKARELAAMGRTAAAIAHEVKNSLNGLSVAAEVHGQARFEIARLRGVAEDLTLFAAPPRLDPGEADLAELCRRAVAATADLAQDCRVEVAFELGEAPAVVPGDAHKLLGALLNVVRNGIEAMGPGAFGEALGEATPPRERRLELTLHRRPGELVVEVGRASCRERV